MKKEISKKIEPGFLRFVFSLIFEKGDKQKNCTSFLRFVSNFLIFEKENKQKIAPGFLKFVSILLGDKQNIAPGFIRFVSMLLF